MQVNLQTYNTYNNKYQNYNPQFSALIIKDGKFWSPERLDLFIRNKEVQKLVTELHKQNKNVLAAKANIIGTNESTIFIHLQEGLKKIAHIKEGALHRFSADEALKTLC